MLTKIVKKKIEQNKHDKSYFKLNLINILVDLKGALHQKYVTLVRSKQKRLAWGQKAGQEALWEDAANDCTHP